MAKVPDVQSQVGPDQEVERIRDIIFGPQMRDYDHRFRTVQDDLDRLHRALERLGNVQTEQEESFGKKLQAARAELRQDDDALRAELRQAVEKLTVDKVDRVNLGDWLIELGTRLKQGSGDEGLLAGLAQLVQTRDAPASPSA